MSYMLPMNIFYNNQKCKTISKEYAINPNRKSENWSNNSAHILKNSPSHLFLKVFIHLGTKRENNLMKFICSKACSKL